MNSEHCLGLCGHRKRCRNGRTGLLHDVGRGVLEAVNVAGGEVTGQKRDVRIEVHPSQDLVLNAA